VPLQFLAREGEAGDANIAQVR